jgi:hypothetical protein
MAAAQHSLIFFVFDDDHVDDVAHPNKIILGRAAPSVADVCSAIRSIFFNGLVPNPPFLQAAPGLALALVRNSQLFIVLIYLFN